MNQYKEKNMQGKIRCVDIKDRESLKIFRPIVVMSEKIWDKRGRLKVSLNFEIIEEQENFNVRIFSCYIDFMYIAK